MPLRVVDKGSQFRKEDLHIENAKILLLGSYKKDVDDMRESPSIKIITI